MFYDAVGQEIQVGSIVAYSTRSSCQAHLNIGKIVKFHVSKDEWSGNETTTFIVKGITSSWYRQDNGKLVANKGTGNLIYPERMIVLDKAKVSAEQLICLDSIKVGE